MVTGVIHSNVPTNLFNLTRDFSDADANKYIRREGKSELLHTTSTIGGAIAGFFAKLGLGAADQKKEREAGVAEIRKMIASEYREFDLPDRVFAKIKDETGRDLSKGVKVGDLELIRQTAKELNTGLNAYVPVKVNDEAFTYAPYKSKKQELIAKNEVQLPKDVIGEGIKLELDINRALNKKDTTDDLKLLNLLVDIRLDKFDQQIDEVQVEMNEMSRLARPDLTEADGDIAELLEFAEKKGVVRESVTVDFDEVIGLIDIVQEERRIEEEENEFDLKVAVNQAHYPAVIDKNVDKSYAPLIDFSEINSSIKN